MSFQPVNPTPFLLELTGLPTSVRLKWGMEFRGILESVDAYMNVQLSQSEEWLNEKYCGNLGEIVIRCNNVLYIRGIEAAELHRNALPNGANVSNNTSNSTINSISASSPPVHPSSDSTSTSRINNSNETNAAAMDEV